MMNLELNVTAELIGIGAQHGQPSYLRLLRNGEVFDWPAALTPHQAQAWAQHLFREVTLTLRLHPQPKRCVQTLPLPTPSPMGLALPAPA